MVINWSDAFLAGVTVGLLMELSAWLMSLLGFGRHSMVSYEGRMLTGKESGAVSYMTGMVMHMGLSVLVAFAWAWSFEAVWHRSSCQGLCPPCRTGSPVA
jgi:hypothetical protein